MARKIEISIDLTKIDKSKIKNHENGSKYYNIEVVEKAEPKYGQNWTVYEKQTKEEREAKKKGVILGNGKNYGWGDQDTPAQKTTISPGPSTDDMPF